jgi:hypothetical protein
MKQRVADCASLGVGHAIGNPLLASVHPQGDERVNAGRAPSRKIAGRDAHERYQHDHAISPGAIC